MLKVCYSECGINLGHGVFYCKYMHVFPVLISIIIIIMYCTIIIMHKYIVQCIILYCRCYKYTLAPGKCNGQFMACKLKILYELSPAWFIYIPVLVDSSVSAELPSIAKQSLST